MSASDDEGVVRSRSLFDETGRPLPEEVLEEEQPRTRVRFTESGQLVEEEIEEEEPAHEFALPCNILPPRGDALGALVLFHGRGTDEHDLYPLLEILDPDRRLLCLTPRAPFEDAEGRCHWYQSHDIGHPDAATFSRTYAHLEGWLELVSEDMEIPADRIVFGGFSQGAVMAYAVALAAHRPQPPALIALSGFIPEVDGLELNLTDQSGLHVAIAHGMNDKVIPVQCSRDARRRLEEAGADVVYRETRLPHAVDPRFLYELPDMIYASLEERAPALNQEG